MDLVLNQEKNDKYRRRAYALVSQMTLEEKVLQTLHNAPSIERLGIKAYNWWSEALHGVARAGVATVFPQAIGLAATFDEDFIETVADTISTEGRAKFNMAQRYLDYDIYKGLTFWSPNVNIFRDPRWGRGHETFGEDPYLSSRLGVRFVMGIQGHDDEHMKAAACAKHFAVHSGPEDQRHYFNAIASKQDMYETYLPAFKACVQEAKVEAVMGAYNRTNGEPCCGSKTLLQDILRDEWGFKGHVVSDCWAIRDFHEHHRVTSNSTESVAMAMNNGCDINCGNQFFYLEKAVEKGLVSMERLDEAVVNLYTTRMKLGLFDGTEISGFDAIPYSEVDSEMNRKLNIKAAEKSIVLLKNEGNLLPLDLEKIGTIGVIGPNANNRRALMGNYEGTASRYVTVLEGIQDYVKDYAKDNVKDNVKDNAKDNVRVLFSEGCHLYKSGISSLGLGNDRLSEIKAVCDASDIIIACLGLDPGLEGEEGDQGNEYASGDKKDLNLPGIQEDILKVMVASGKPVILVLLSGSALAIGYAKEHVPGIMQGWYPGSQGGTAIANVLFGHVSPEGRLPVTFYKTTEELPEFVDYSMKGRTYRYMTTEPLYPFGYGLSYSDLSYSDVAVSSEELTTEAFTIKGRVTNGGTYDTTETVQVYIKSFQEGAPNRQLKAVCKVFLKAGQSKEVSLDLPMEAFGLYDEEGRRHVRKGRYEVSFGGFQSDERSEELTGKQIAKKTIQAPQDYMNV